MLFQLRKHNSTTTTIRHVNFNPAKFKGEPIESLSYMRNDKFVYVVLIL